MLYIYLNLANFFVVLAETSHKTTRVLTRIARFYIEKTKKEAFRIDPLAELVVDHVPEDAYVPSRVRHRRASKCSYCRSLSHTRPRCEKYRLVKREESRLNSWLRKYQFRASPADMNLQEDPLGQLFT